ncbi:hypothetical protein KP803_11790 [Vibrio sp. ZSDE26]|uniref:Secreted protein n=1 Tax=Vibrio amylolyticus TaxID=2847292 RepID=A0A9X1XIN9_9VIBR|nr:hypothetical protein [Vibrio amylolyticus]MCK6263952.1 hypothetical protein [Vibrio amylolyticus]
MSIPVRTFFTIFIACLMGVSLQSHATGIEPLVGTLKNIYVASYHHGSSCLSLSEKEFDNALLSEINSRGVEAIDKHQYFDISLQEASSYNAYGRYGVNLFTQKLDNNLCVAHIEARLSFDVKALIPYTQDQTTQIHHSFIINNQILVGEAEKIMLEIEEFNAVSAKLLTNYVLRYKQKTLSKYPEVKHHFGE